MGMPDPDWLRHPRPVGLATTDQYTQALTGLGRTKGQLKRTGCPGCGA